MKEKTMPTDKRLSQWLDLLKSHNADVRAQAANAIVSMGPAAFPAVKQAFEKDSLSRYQSVKALSRVGPLAIPVVAELLDVDAGGHFHRQVIVALQAIGTDAIPCLVRLLSNADPEIRCHAAEALDKFGIAARPALEQLVALLGDDHQMTRWAAASALKHFGPEAKAAVPDLVRLFGQGDSFVTFEDTRGILGTNDYEVALKSIGAAGIPVMVEMLGANDPSVRKNACSALVAMGSDAAVAIPALEALQTDSREAVRVEAAECLKQVRAPQ